ncbi:hypothetical protein [Blastopirellula marina]|uniref:Uncharacterized protein n=1 Tax=Blastopirellula marina DSM 3645 TaxID=314230 RepID=A3ZSL2_9BACT|nr:hypothetical protein [Blastopirellula marina]EAQ80672.1 hypothetical protein DSM3645_15040 [Blastopirellula marina DSM 3645]
MLEQQHLAMIRAALRYWSEEMTPHDGQAASPYFESDEESPLNATEITALIDELKTLKIGYVAVDGINQKVLSDCIYRQQVQISSFERTAKIAVILFPRGA